MIFPGRINRLTIGGRDKNAERKLRYFYVHKGMTFPGFLPSFILLKDYYEN